MVLQARLLVVTVMLLALQCNARLIYAKNPKAMLQPQVDAVDSTAADVSSMPGRFSGRRLLSTLSQLPTTLAQGKKVDFSDGGIGTQQESTEDAIAADVSSVAGRFSGRKLRSSLAKVPPSLAQGKAVDFVDGGLDSQEDSAVDSINADEHSVARLARP